MFQHEWYRMLRLTDLIQQDSSVMELLRIKLQYKSYNSIFCLSKCVFYQVALNLFYAMLEHQYSMNIQLADISGWTFYLLVQFEIVLVLVKILS